MQLPISFNHLFRYSVKSNGDINDVPTVARHIFIKCFKTSEQASARFNRLKLLFSHRCCLLLRDDTLT